MDIFNSLLKTADNEYAAIVEDGIDAGDIKFWIDTGSYSLNALLSGSIFGGLAGNKRTVFAGDPSTGKTFYTLSIVKDFLNLHPQAFVFYFESEGAVSKQMMVDRNIDVTRIAVMPVVTVQEFRTQAVKILDAYKAAGGSPDKNPMMFVLDSLGNLSTSKEVEDIADGKDTRDMTRAQLIKAAFRVLTLKLGQFGVPLITTNHVYANIGGYGPLKKMGGGCLVAGTMIQMSNGTKPIEEIVVGDEVYTLYGAKPVINTFEFNDKDVYEIQFEDGTIVKCSNEHKFFVDGVWVTAEDLAQNTNLPNLEVEDIFGDNNVLRQQMFLHTIDITT